jgi:hypothetical protein
MMIPKEYENETDYRKIPREYLNPRIPQGRGSVKWSPFASIPAQYEMLQNHIDNQNKVERPELSYDQLMILNETVHIKIANHEPTLIEYWKQGYFYQQVAFIKEVNILEKQLIIANEQGNETLKIPMEDKKELSNLKNRAEL